MSEQLNQMQLMLEQLIKMTGSNNASIEELRQDTKASIKELRQDVTEIKTTMATKEDMNRLADESQKDIIAMLHLIDNKTDKLDDKFDALNERLFTQETQLQRLKKLAK